MPLPQAIFCCTAAAPINTSNSLKRHNDPNREVHEAIYQSFLAFAYRREREVTLMELITGRVAEPEKLPLSNIPQPQAPFPQPVLTTQALKNNPMTPNSPYVIHVTSRCDFGPVLSHRYFVCPPDLKLDWVEVSLEQWFAAGAQFNHKADKWDLKCPIDSRFYRLTLRPNLAMRFVQEEPARRWHGGEVVWEQTGVY